MMFVHVQFALAYITYGELIRQTHKSRLSRDHPRPVRKAIAYSESSGVPIDRCCLLSAFVNLLAIMVWSNWWCCAIHLALLRFGRLRVHHHRPLRVLRDSWRSWRVTSHLRCWASGVGCRPAGPAPGLCGGTPRDLGGAVGAGSRVSGAGETTTQMGRWMVE